MTDYKKKLESVLDFIHDKIDGGCSMDISFDQFINDVEKAIGELKDHYYYLPIGHCTEYKVHAQFWYKVPYLHKKLWKTTAAYVYDTVKSYIEKTKNESKRITRGVPEKGEGKN